jgi:DNA-binding beta-propeller fold protein YncE
MELFRLGIPGSDLKAFEGSLWLEDHASTNHVYRIDPSTQTVTGEFDAGRPCSIATGLGSVWVADLDGGRLLQVDPATADVIRAIDGFPMACDPDVGGGFVWVPISHGVARYDPATGSVDVIEVEEDSAGVAFLDGSVWLTPLGSDTVREVDASTLETIRSIQLQDPLPPVPAGPTVASGVVFVFNEDAGTVTRINAESGEIDWVIETDFPARLEPAFDSLWSTSYLEGTVTRIDPESGKILGVAPAGRNPNGLAALGDSMWVIDTASGILRRIDPALFPTTP